MILDGDKGCEPGNLTVPSRQELTQIRDRIRQIVNQEDALIGLVDGGEQGLELIGVAGFGSFAKTAFGKN